MTVSEEILKLVPGGEENAVSSRLIWQQIGMWSASSVKHELHKLAAQGVIQSKIDHRNGNEVSLYFRAPK